MPESAAVATDHVDEVENSNHSFVLTVIALLPLVYLLSVGPATAIVRAHAPVGAGFLDVFYAPVIWLHNFTPLETPIEWYVALWAE